MAARSRRRWRWSVTLLLDHVEVAKVVVEMVLDTITAAMLIIAVLKWDDNNCIKW
jgi:hypothetical protein